MEGLDTRPFDVCLVLLRGHRAGFEGLTLGEQLGQLELAFAYVELGINKPRNVRIKSDVSQVRREAEAGRELLRRALGDAEAADLIRKRKAEFEWWQTLTEEQKSRQRQADWWVYDGWPEDLVGGLGFSGARFPTRRWTYRDWRERRSGPSPSSRPRPSWRPPGATATRGCTSWP